MLASHEKLDNRQAFALACGGFLALFVAMGIGRFAYTPMLPLMQSTYGFGDAWAGYLASANYIGYFIGAVVASRWGGARSRLVRAGLLAGMATTALMAASGWLPLWAALRLVSGVASGLVFVAASSLVLDALARGGRAPWAGGMYAGVGAGISATGAAVPALGPALGAAGGWLALGAASAVLAAAAAALLRPRAGRAEAAAVRAAGSAAGPSAAGRTGGAAEHSAASTLAPVPAFNAGKTAESAASDHSEATQTSAAGKAAAGGTAASPAAAPGSAAGTPAAQGEGAAKGTATRSGWKGTLLPWLLAAYACEGFGYIITGTFLVSMAGRIPGLHASPSWMWCVAGLAAVPSSYLWAKCMQRFGIFASMLAAYGIQIVGVALPAVWPTEAGFYTSAVLFGATFMGIVTLVTSAARQAAPERSRESIGAMTAAYGVGQVLGPVCAGWLLSYSGGSYTGALAAAAAVLLAGIALFTSGVLKLNIETTNRMEDHAHALRKH